jgi:predicted nuclease with TOPRIM domain
LLITELLVAKDSELKEVLKLATEQAKINHKMESLKREVERQDQFIQQLQRQLKEAEQILVSEYYIVLCCGPHVTTRLKWEAWLYAIQFCIAPL